MSAAQGSTPRVVSSTNPVVLPAELTEPLPEDAPLVAVAARTAAETALGVPGVHRLGSLVTRAADAVRASLGRSAASPGVRVDEEDGHLDVSVAIVVEYPSGVVTVADDVRRQVRAALGQLAAGAVRVDVRVLDVHGPFDPVEDAAEEPTAADSELVEAVTGTPAGDVPVSGGVVITEPVADIASSDADGTGAVTDTASAGQRAADAAADAASASRSAAAAAAAATAAAADAAPDRAAADGTSVDVTVVDVTVADADGVAPTDQRS